MNAALPDLFPDVPELEPRCGSWVIVDRRTGKAVFETFTRKVAASVNQCNYEVLTALEWLKRINSINRKIYWE